MWRYCKAGIRPCTVVLLLVTAVVAQVFLVAHEVWLVSVARYASDVRGFNGSSAYR